MENSDSFLNTEPIDSATIDSMFPLPSPRRGSVVARPRGRRRTQWASSGRPSLCPTPRWSRSGLQQPKQRVNNKQPAEVVQLYRH